MPKILKRYNEEEHEELWSRPQGGGRSRLDLSSYEEIVRELDNSPSLTIELEDEEDPKRVKSYLTRVAKGQGKGLKFQRINEHSRELTFRLQTPKEKQMFFERGQNAYAGRVAKGGPAGRKKKAS